MSDPSPKDEHHAAVSAWISQEFLGYLDEKMDFYLSSDVHKRNHPVHSRMALAEVLEDFVTGYIKTLLVMGAPGNMPKGILSLTNWEIVSQYFIDTYSNSKES